MIRDWRAEHRARLKKKNGRPRDRTGERARGLYLLFGHQLHAHATVDGARKEKDDETCHDPIGRYVSLLCFPVRQFMWMDGSSYACMYGNEEILATACVAHPAMMH
ncbi:hypothetical protein FPSE_03529 [Fusarium pseudograminearum CS3096]|uniref:Uncharacterized protein n=1 Tax=Fusarium pseudograminearum (strain CS3096) TaxID=1028729 RepID=K3VNA7_FUSPC|nr:hypothetical protein FPSE_03529 [Fusarium pseudograminearum CS3096]EKJ76274.1 hypothetical protein FPSE_03529 [Fusarium pseudograminearum CS3096]